MMRVVCLRRECAAKPAENGVLAWLGLCDFGDMMKKEGTEHETVDRV